MIQYTVNHGTLIKWNKGFTNANAIDKDPADMLEAALARQGMKVSLCWRLQKMTVLKKATMAIA